jgi:Ca-activated chloride channel family protein
MRSLKQARLPAVDASSKIVDGRGAAQMTKLPTALIARTAMCRVEAIVAFLAVLALILIAPKPAAAADVSANAKSGFVMGGSQGGKESTLELPSVPAAQGTMVPQVTASAPQQELIIPSRQLRTQSGYAQVTVTVTDPRGSYVAGLQKDDFKLFLDNRARPIEFFRQDTDTPVSIGILVDTSGSMTTKIVQARIAIAQFVRGLNSGDDVFLFAFAGTPFQLAPSPPQVSTTDHSLILRRLNLLDKDHTLGQTSLFDVILRGLQMVQQSRYDKKALLLVTDGMDTASRASVDQVIAQARRLGVLVYSIGIGDPNPSFPALAIGPFVLGGDLVDAATLYTLSTETGGRTYIIRQAGDGEMLRRACAEISHELRQQYTIGFVAPDASAGGYRSLKVDVPTHKDASVRVRKGLDLGGSHSGYADASGGSTATIP